MAYNGYSFQGYGSGYQRSPWRAQNQGNFRNQFNNGSYSASGGAPKKHSGAKHGTYANKKGKSNEYVQGWNVSRRNGMLKFFCASYNKSHTGKSKSGKVWITWIAKIQPEKGQPYILPCLFYPATKKVVIGSLGVVLNPSAPHGGYCGRFTKK
jgi:hypothetical protein